MNATEPYGYLTDTYFKLNEILFNKILQKVYRNDLILTLDGSAAAPVVYRASLDEADHSTPLGAIRVVLNSEPLASIDCMREADALVLTSASSFSKLGSLGTLSW